MNTLVQKLLLASLVIAITGCAHYPQNYSYYPAPSYNRSYYAGGYETYGHHYPPQQPSYRPYPRSSWQGSYSRPHNEHEERSHHSDNHDHHSQNEGHGRRYDHNYRQR